MAWEDPAKDAVLLLAAALRADAGAAAEAAWRRWQDARGRLPFGGAERVCDCFPALRHPPPLEPGPPAGP